MVRHRLTVRLIKRQAYRTGQEPKYLSYQPLRLVLQYVSGAGRFPLRSHRSPLFLPVILRPGRPKFVRLLMVAFTQLRRRWGY